MGLKIETWTVAYRKKKEKSLLEDTSNFHIIKNGHKGWYADPFLFDYNGKTYLFVEYYSYKLGRGIISYSEYDIKKQRFSKYKPIIIEDYHLSYPNVFILNGKIYMMPEAHQSESLYVYEAVHFPEEWKKVKVLIQDIKLVDTTPFELGDSLRAISMQVDTNNMLLLDIEKDSLNIIKYKSINDDISVSRPGGKVIRKENDIIFVTQDCSDEYGKALNFIKVDNLDKEKPFFDIVKKIEANQIQVINGPQASGVHTYNTSEEFEVIDLKYYKKSYYRVFIKLIRQFKR